MAEMNATILIPDISGFTEFMNSTELTHSSHAINYLIDAIVNAVGQDYELAEVEGDAVLLIKKGPAPPEKKFKVLVLKSLMRSIISVNGCNSIPFVHAGLVRRLLTLP